MSSTDQLSCDDANSVDGEGVWAPEIESAFHEGLKLFPPCGRRKHILQEEGGGKMYGRNELIARHILMRTGKIRTRKQVSSHIQVLNRRKHKLETHSTSASTSSDTPSPPSGLSISLSGGSSLSSSTSNGLINNHLNQNHSLTHYNNNNNNNNNTHHINNIQLHQNNAVNRHHLHHHHHHHHQQQHQNQFANNNGDSKRHETIASGHQNLLNGFYDFWNDGPIVTQKIRLVEFSAFIEHRNFQQSTLPVDRRLNMMSSMLGNGVDQLHRPGHSSEQQQYTSSIYSLASAQYSNHIYEANGNQIPKQTSSLTSGSTNNMLTTNANNSNRLDDVNNHHRLNSHQHQLLNNHHPPTQFGAASTNPNTSGLTRHCYIKIDYSQSTGRQTNKLERIDINEIQDKFPDIGGPDGLFQRSPVDSFFLVKFWADLNNDYEYNIDDQNSYFGFSSHFETLEPYRFINCSTKACSYGNQVVEKVDNIYGAFNSSNGRYSYDIDRTPMCEFMIQFIKKLRQLPEPSQMNSVLENFTVLQVITSESTSEILMCLAYVFEVASSEQNNGPQYHVYKLAKDLNLNCSK